jgi:hypothetical protein
MVRAVKLPIHINKCLLVKSQTLSVIFSVALQICLKNILAQRHFYLKHIVKYLYLPQNVLAMWERLEML